MTDAPRHVEAYASALLQIASAEEDPAAAADEMYHAAVGLSGHPELIDTLADARIPGERKQGIVNDVLGSHAAGVTVAAMNFLVAAGQSRHLREIAARVAELGAEAEGEVVAEVTAPSPLSDDQVERLKAALESSTGRRVQVKVAVDPAVVGGLVAKVGDTVLDGSVRRRFAELREQWG